MDVDASIVGVTISLFDSLEPENAGDDRIAPRSIWLDNLPGRPTGMKHRTEGESHTDLRLHEELPKRCHVATKSIANSKFGGRDRIDGLRLAIGFEKQLLILDAHDDLMMGIAHP